MPRSLSSLKRVRQDKVRAARNKGRRTRIKSALRTADDALQANDASKAEAACKSATRILDRSADLGTIHRNTAARRKSRLAKRLNAVKAGK